MFFFYQPFNLFFAILYTQLIIIIYQMMINEHPIFKSQINKIEIENMGNNLIHPNFNIQLHQPPLHLMKPKHQLPPYTIWKHNHGQSSLIQYHHHVTNKTQINNLIEQYLFRHQHRYLVSNEFLRVNQNKISIFYERIITNLQKITDIPYQDTLKFYHVAFKGFQVLYKKFGYFQVTDDMLFVTEDKNVKVWCNKNIQSMYPGVPGQGSQELMVKQIIRIMQSNSEERQQNQYPVSSVLYNQYSRSFSEALTALQNICISINILIPHRLSCLDILQNEQVMRILDIYGQNTNNKELINTHKKHTKGLKLFQNAQQQLKTQKQQFILFQRNQAPSIQHHNQGLLSRFQVNNSNSEHYRLNHINNITFQGRNILRSRSRPNSSTPKIYFNNSPSPIHRLPHQSNFNRSISPINISNNNINKRNLPVIYQNVHSRKVQRPPLPPRHYKNNDRPQNQPFNNIALTHSRSHYQIIPHPQKAHHQIQPLLNNNRSIGIIKPRSQSVTSQQSYKHQNKIKQTAGSRRTTLINKLSKFNAESNKPQIRPNIDNNNSFESKQNKIPFQTNISKQNYIPNNIELKNNDDKQVGFTKPQFWQHVFNRPDPITHIRTKDKQKSHLQYLSPPKTALQQRQSNKINTKLQHITYKFKQDGSPEQPENFPSVTDISDNVSCLPTFEKIEGKTNKNSIWHEESAVMSYDHNQPTMKWPKQKKYEPNIDKQIMQDLKMLRNKKL